LSRQRERTTTLGQTASGNQNILRTALETHQIELLTGIRVYLWKLGAVTQQSEIEDKAEEILQETAIEALRCADNYDPSRAVKPWLLGVALNRIRQMKRNSYRQSRVIVSIQEAAQAKAANQHSPASKMTEEELLDLLYYDDPNRKQTLAEILSVIDRDDREILTLHFVECLTGEELASALGTTVGAAYVRLSRAKNRLRQRYRKGESQ
jgi:RNA polymerase sigma factor (sigma-70 family)